MPILYAKMLFSFPMMFFFGVNLHNQQPSKSVNFKEATEAYKK